MRQKTRVSDPRKPKRKKQKINQAVRDKIKELQVEHPHRTENILTKAAKTHVSGIQNMTKHERMFDAALKKHDYTYEPQKVFMNSYSYYCVDFFLSDMNKVVEIDGGYHYTGGMQQKDSERTKTLLVENGVKSVVRFSNKEIEADAGKCVRLALELEPDNRFMDDVIEFNSSSVKVRDMYSFFPSSYSDLMQDRVKLDEIVRRYASNVVTKHRKNLEAVGLLGEQLKMGAYMAALTSISDVCDFNVIDEVMHMGIRNFFDRVHKCIFDDCKHIIAKMYKETDTRKPVMRAPVDSILTKEGKATKEEFFEILGMAKKLNAKNARRNQRIAKS